MKDWPQGVMVVPTTPTTVNSVYHRLDVITDRPIT